MPQVEIMEPSIPTVRAVVQVPEWGPMESHGQLLQANTGVVVSGRSVRHPTLLMYYLGVLP
jgi:hypothetical protein